MDGERRDTWFKLEPLHLLLRGIALIKEGDLDGAGQEGLLPLLIQSSTLQITTKGLADQSSLSKWWSLRMFRAATSSA